MKSTSVELSTLRSVLDENRRYRIPDYQRRYAWRTSRVERLWEDIVDMYRDKDRRKNEYLLGSIVTVASNGAEDVVDGQQRLVSLTLMFCALRDSLTDHLARSDGDLKSDIKSAIGDIEDRIVNGRSAFIELNNYEDSLLLDAICRADKADDKLKSLKRDASKAFRRNYDELRRRADGLCTQVGIARPDLAGIDDLREILKSIASRVFVVDVTVKDEKKARQIFQALNSTGQPLTQADLIKNHLIQCGQPGQGVEGGWKDAFAPFDREIRKSPTKSDGYIYDSLLSRNYQAGRAGKDVGKCELYEAVKAKIKEGYTAKEFIRDLKQDMLIIDMLENPQSKDHALNHMLHGLNQVRAVYFRRPIIAAARKWDWESHKTRSLVDTLLKFFFMYRTVCRMDVDKLRGIARELTREIERQDDIEAAELCKKIVGEVSPLEKFHKKFLGEFAGQEYTRAAAKYILISIERGLQTELEVQTKFDIEHVFPQKPRPKAWPNHAELEPYKDNIANLTLLPGKWNKALQNYKFDTKKSGVKDNGEVITPRGKRGGKPATISYDASRIELNRYFRDCDKWDREEVLRRQKELLKHAKSIWNLEECLEQAKG